MKSTKIEIILVLLCFCIIISAAIDIIPSQQMTPPIIWQYIASSATITLLIALVYRKIRNKRVKKQIDKLKRKNNFEQYVAYVVNCTKSKPKLIWLQYEKAVAYAISGRIRDFEITYNQNYEKMDITQKKNLDSSRTGDGSLS